MTTFRRLDADAATLLRAYRPASEDQRRQRDRVLDHLGATAAATWRGSGPVHLTASLLVLSPDGTQVLLALHRKAGRWLQLGGHLEGGDPGLREGAAREGREESGLASLEVLPGVVDVDCHELGAGFTRCREHLDVRFAGVAHPRHPLARSAESGALAWFDASELPPGTGADVPRLVAAAQAAVAAWH